VRDITSTRTRFGSFKIDILNDLSDVALGDLRAVNVNDFLLSKPIYQ
jgi:hypothetical protein